MFIDVIWYEGIYQVNKEWVVISLSRIVPYTGKKRWWWYNNTTREIKWQIMKQWYKWPYKTVRLAKKQYLVHRIVYCSFNKIPLKFEWQKSNTIVMHKDDNWSNNNLDNLMMWSQQDNMDDMVKKWRRTYRRATKQKIWFEDVERIKKEYKKLWSIYKVAPLFWVSYATISRVINWKIWSI